MRRSPFTVSALVLVLALVGAACSDDSSSESAQEAVCSDVSDFKDSVNQLVEDVKSGNFGDAQDQVATVKSDFEALTSSAEKLASSTKTSVEDDLDAVKSTLENLSSASSMEDVESVFNTAESQLKATADSITGTLSC